MVSSNKTEKGQDTVAEILFHRQSPDHKFPTLAPSIKKSIKMKPIAIHDIPGHGVLMLRLIPAD